MWRSDILPQRPTQEVSSHSSRFLLHLPSQNQRPASKLDPKERNIKLKSFCATDGGQKYGEKHKRVTFFWSLIEFFLPARKTQSEICFRFKLENCTFARNMPLTPWISLKFPFHALASFKFPHDSPHLTGLLFGLYCQCNAMSDSYAGLPPPRPTQSTTDTRSHRRTRMKYSAAITREASFIKCGPSIWTLSK